MQMYALHDHGLERDGDEQAWARQLSEQTWWTRGSPPAHAWITLEGRRLRRWSRRRETPGGMSFPGH